jgi:hypothetical protein
MIFTSRVINESVIGQSPINFEGSGRYSQFWVTYRSPGCMYSLCTVCMIPFFLTGTVDKSIQYQKVCLSEIFSFLLSGVVKLAPVRGLNDCLRT